MRKALVVAAGLAIAIAESRTLAAQTLAGRVTRADLPVSGALVLLLDANSRVVAQTASRERGEYSVSARAAGNYRVQVLQIGWRPTMAGPFALVAGATTTANIDATGSRILLEPIIVTDHSECRVNPDSAAGAFVLWDEARKALLAATMTRAEPLTMSVSRTVQDLDRSGGRVRWDSTTMQVGLSLRPFISLPPDSLARIGYMSSDNVGNKTYWAPDADVLLSESFVSSHCLHLVRPTGQSADSARLIGVGFAPATKRRNIIDVDGVVWLDRSSGELRAIDYHYVNTSSVVEQGNPGGRVEFLRIPGGRWIVHRWTIRVPSTTIRVRRGDTPAVPGERRVDTQVEELSGIRRTSGQVSEIRRGSDVLWERGRVTVLVRVVDSLSNQPIRGVLVRAAESLASTATDSTGTVRLDRVQPGPLTVRLESASLDAMGRSPMLAPVEVPASNDVTLTVPVPSERAMVVAKCGGRTVEWGEGLLRGALAGAADSLARRTPIVVSWQTRYARLGGGDPVIAEERRDVTLGSDGSFEICGVPRDATISIHRGTAADPVATTRFAPGALAVRVAIRN